MTANVVTDLLSAPLSPDWTIEGLAEQLLETIVAQSEKEFILDAAETTDRQSRRLLRPLLACLANMSAAESGAASDMFGGQLSFKRTGPEGPVCIVGKFENKADNVRAIFERFSSPPRSEASETTATKSTRQPNIQFNTTGESNKDTARPASPSGGSDLAEKRRRAESWAAEYAMTVRSGVLTGTSIGVVATSGSPSHHAVKMCYEIGKIYRDSWSYGEADALAHSLQLRDQVAVSSIAGAMAHAVMPTLGPIAALLGMLAGSGNESSLQSMSELIIKHFESGS